jgi:hypothetical protein
MKTLLLAALFFSLFNLPLLAQGQSPQVEKSISNNNGINPFNYDNIIYTNKKTYVYDYVIIKGADKFKYNIASDSSGKKRWDYVQATCTDSSTVCY